MKYRFTREQIKQIIFEELKKSQKAEVEAEVDNLIDSYLSLSEQENEGFFADLLKIIQRQPEDQQEEMAEIALMKAQSRRDALKKIGIGAAILATGVGVGSYLKHLENLALADTRQHRAAADKFRSGEGYEGPRFIDQQEYYLQIYTRS